MFFCDVHATFLLRVELISAVRALGAFRIFCHRYLFFSAVGLQVLLRRLEFFFSVQDFAGFGESHDGFAVSDTGYFELVQSVVVEVGDPVRHHVLLHEIVGVFLGVPKIVFFTGNTPT